MNTDKDLTATTDAHHRPVRVHYAQRPVTRVKDLIATLTRITGQFGYTHKDPERVYKLSRVKVCEPKIQIQILYSPSFTTRKVFRKR